MARGRVKPPDQLTGHRDTPGRERTGLITLRAPDEVTIPPMPMKATDTGMVPLHDDAIAVWDSFWRSPLSKLVDLDGDMAALKRWILAWDEWVELKADFDKAPISAGSTGQDRLNPLATRIATVEDTIAKYEDRFGMTPMARFRLGIALGQAAGSLEDLMRSLGAGGEGEEEDEWHEEAP